jgi:cytochrome c
MIGLSFSIAAMMPLAAQAAGDAKAGAAVYQAQCAMCHAVTPGIVGIGPSLAGIYGKPAASGGGYDYSSALMGAHIVWTSDALGKFLTSPQADVAGTKMPFAGLTDATQRADVIAYIASLPAS